MITMEDQMGVKLVTVNLRRVLYTSLILVIWLPILFLIYLMFPVGEEVRLLFEGTFISFELVSVAYFIITTKIAGNADLITTSFSIYSFWAFFEFFGLLLSFVLYYEQRDLTVYYMTIAAITIVAIMYTKALLIYIGVELVFTVVMMIFLKMEPYHIVGAAMINGMFVLLSRVLFKAQVSTHLMKEKVKNISQDSEKDPLTGLMNRRGLERNVKRAWPQASRNKHIFSIIMMDIDNFKKYNDHFGHPQGDVCLKSVASAIKSAAARETDIPARVGGEEFIVCIPEAGNQAEALRLAEKIRTGVEALKIPHSPLVSNPYVTLSIGVASVIPGEGDSFEKLYQEADNSLYKAKKNGRNCIVSGNYIYGGNTAPKLKEKTEEIPVTAPKKRQTAETRKDS